MNIIMSFSSGKSLFDDEDSATIYVLSFMHMRRTLLYSRLIRSSISYFRDRHYAMSVNLP